MVFICVWYYMEFFYTVLFKEMVFFWGVMWPWSSAFITDDFFSLVSGTWIFLLWFFRSLLLFENWCPLFGVFTCWSWSSDSFLLLWDDSTSCWGACLSSAGFYLFLPPLLLLFFFLELLSTVSLYWIWILLDSVCCWPLPPWFEVWLKDCWFWFYICYPL